MYFCLVPILDFIYLDCGWERRERQKEERTYVSWTDDSTVPVGHEDIVAVLEAIGARSVSDALLTLLEFL